MENPSLNEIKTRINFLMDILDRKYTLLCQIYNITENQELFEKTMSGEDCDILIKEAVNEKQKIIDEVIAADNTFMRVFGEFKGALNRNKDLFKAEIKQMQDKIRRVSDMDYKIRAKEMRAKRGVYVENQASVLTKKIKALKSSKNYILQKYKKNASKGNTTQL